MGIIGLKYLMNPFSLITDILGLLNFIGEEMFPKNQGVKVQQMMLLMLPPKQQRKVVKREQHKLLQNSVRQQEKDTQRIPKSLVQITQKKYLSVPREQREYSKSLVLKQHQVIKRY